MTLSTGESLTLSAGESLTINRAGESRKSLTLSAGEKPDRGGKATAPFFGRDRSTDVPAATAPSLTLAPRQHRAPRPCHAPSPPPPPALRTHPLPLPRPFGLIQTDNCGPNKGVVRVSWLSRGGRALPLTAPRLKGNLSKQALWRSAPLVATKALVIDTRRALGSFCSNFLCAAGWLRSCRQNDPSLNTATAPAVTVSSSKSE